MKNYFLYTLLTILSLPGFSQTCSNLNIQWQSDIGSTCSYLVMTMLHDRMNRPFLYVANKDGGLKVYDVSNLSVPSLVATVPVSQYENLDVMSVSQNGNYIYLALGNSFNNTQSSGIAIIDVSTPSSAFLTAYWKLPGSTGGSGIVKTEGNYAYLGSMGNGLVILDISDKYNIQFVSQFIPALYFPDPNPDPTKFNARGMEIKNDIVYLCYDAGGIRIINVTDKNNPVETGRYSNPVMNGKPRAYNNIVVDDSMAYVAVDYCGMEVLNISDTSQITMSGWWNPYNCPNNNWFTSPVHANEIAYDRNCGLIFMSSGKSDMMVVDVSNHASPDSCGFYGGVSNNTGTWGIDLYEGKIFLSYVCAFFPFSSNWTGVKALKYDQCVASGVIGEKSPMPFRIYPNPSIDNIIVDMNGRRIESIEIADVAGRVLISEQCNGNSIWNIDLKNISDGLYIVKIKSGGEFYYSKFLSL